jgi:hypothetical protein
MELVEWELVERTGWTFEYIDALPLSRLHQYEQIKDAKTKVRK